MAIKNGFQIPNAVQSQSVTKGYKLSEPDQEDWISLGNGRYGVVAGCTASISAPNILFTESNNIVLVNGSVRYLPSTISLSLLVPAAQDRFDVLIWDDDIGSVRLVEGVPAEDPVFPTISPLQVFLYAIWVPAGVGSLDNSYLVDKRVLLSSSLVTSATDEQTIISNTRGPSDSPYTVQGSGKTTWSGDVSLYHHSARTLGVNDSLRVGNTFTVGRQITSLGAIQADGLLTASNFDRGFGPPSTPEGTTADIYVQQDAGGAIWFKTDSGWSKLIGDVNVGDDPIGGVPPGSFIASLLPTGHRYLSGYLALDGSTHSATSVARLWGLAQEGLQPFAGWDNGDGTMTLPNANGTVWIQRPDGSVGVTAGSNLKTIETQNLPYHKHFSSTSTASNGVHTHSGTIAGGQHNHTIGSGGAHSHDVVDPLHHHVGTDQYAQYFVGVVWGGQNKLDGPFNDASHTWTVDVAASTNTAATGISIGRGQSAHDHQMSLDAHTHTVTLQTTGGHTHALPTESGVGQNVPLDITPASIGVKYYVKV